MTDFRFATQNDLVAVTLDLLQTPVGLLDESRELETAAIVALGTDRRAFDDDPLPGLDNDDRRGWWGDLQAEDIWGGWPIGSRLWLLSRAKITDRGARQGSTLRRAEDYVREALTPFLEKGLASRMAVQAERTDPGGITVHATLYRGPRPAVRLQFQSLWDELSA